jgi:hypothetical protein
MPSPRQRADKQNTEQNDWPLNHMQNKYRINLLLSDINYMYSLKISLMRIGRLSGEGTVFPLIGNCFYLSAIPVVGGWQSEATSS